MSAYKKLTSLALLSMVSLITASCGSPGTDGKKGDNEATKPDEPAELTFYGRSTQTEDYFNLYYGDAIRKKFPNYTLKYIQKGTGTDLPDLIAAGTPIDIYYATVGNFESAVQSFGLQVDMTDLIKKINIDTSRFEPTLLEAMKLNTGGPVYGLPVQSNVEVLYYNKALFDQFGVPYLKDGMTWDDAIELSKKLTRNDGGKQYYGFSTTFDHILRMNQFSLPRVNAKTGLPTISAEPKWKTFFDTVYVKMMQGDAYVARMAANTTLRTTNAFIKDQDVAMFAFMSQLYLTNPAELRAMNWDIVSLPTFKELPGVGSQSYPMYFGITKMTKNVDAAMKVMKYMVSDEFQIGLARKGWMSSLNIAAVQKEYGQDTEFKDKNYKALFVKPAPIAYAPEYDPALVSAYVQAADSISKGTDLNTAFRLAEETALKAINEAKAK